MMSDIKYFFSENDLLSFVKENAEIYQIYVAGAGSYGRLIGEYFLQNDITWHGYVDKDSRKKELLGKSVVPYTSLPHENVFVIISSNTLFDVLYNELKQLGIHDDCIGLAVCKEYMMKSRRQDDRLLQYRDRYFGKRCFIVCNGPSLTVDDLNKIKGEYSFGCNGIFGVFSHTDWRPNFYCTLDNLVIEHLYTSLQGKAINWPCSMFSLRNEIDAYDIKKEFITCNSIDDLDFHTGLPKFSSDCLQYVYTIGTVTYYMLQLAVYMGFKEIVFLGLDFNFSVERHSDGHVVEKNIPNHMPLIDAAQPAKDSLIMQRAKEIDGYYYVGYVDKQRAGFSVANQYAEEHGIRILNASRATKLDVFKRVNLDDYLRM